MPDKRSREKERRRREWLQAPSRRMRLYSDEDIPSSMVEMLRAGGAKVLTTRRAGNAGKDDRFQVAFAAREGLVLVTHNRKHYLNDRLVPFHITRGVIALDVGNRSETSDLTVQAIITECFVPYAELYENMKIRLSSTGGTFRFIGRTGEVRTVTLSLDDLVEGCYPTEDE
jgi:predicted nuclease of predicted toxin-antitoxin system